MINVDQLPKLHRDLFIENKWSKEYIEKLINEPSEPEVYPNVLVDLYNCVGKIKLASCKILTVGSITPWIECYLLRLGAKKVYVTDVTKIDIEDDRIVFIDFDSIENHNIDLIVSFSSIEHFGLGRYGDELNENGDIEFMKRVYHLLPQKGSCIIGVPVAQEYKLDFPWHRIYDPERLGKLIENYKIVLSSKNNKISSDVDFEFDRFYSYDWQNQPCILLKK